MRPLIFAAAAVLLMAGALGQAALRSTGVQSANDAITDCARSTDAAAREDACSQVIPGSTPGHTVLAGACGDMDLHLVRYVPEDSSTGEPLTAYFCR